MPKILYFITQSEFGGAQRYVFDLANNLKGNFQVAIALGEQGKNGKLAKILQENNIKYFIIPHLKRSLSPINDILAFFKIIKLIKNYRPDIIHLNSSKISILGSIAAFIIKLRVTSYELRIIYTVHGWVFNEPLPVLIKYFYLYAEKFTAGFKNKIICVSEYDKRVAIKYKIAPEKLVTIHNGLTLINFYPKEEAREILHSRVMGYELQDARLLIGSVGNLYKTKSYEYLVEAANILISGYHLPFTFIIIGDGSERKNLENLIKKYNLKNNFILAGQIDEAAKLLKAFDIYVCSSVKEGLPYSILEAMAAGLPIVSTNVGGISEMIGDEKTGLLVKPAEARELAEKIKTLLNNKTLAQELGQSAKEKVKTEFGLEKMVAETKRVYL
ncbi:MAG: glycosyltransferase family 4 protein [Candidatus Falkowbacteria bacterium]